MVIIVVGIYASKQEPLTVVICKDGSRENVTPETQFVCNGVPVHYDAETNTYEIARYARNSIMKDAINDQIKKDLDCLITTQNLTYAYYNASNKAVRYEDSNIPIWENNCSK